MIAQRETMKNNALGVLSNYKAGATMTVRQKPDIRQVAASTTNNRPETVVEKKATPDKKKQAMQSFWIAVGVAALLVLAMKLKLIKV
jgi:hypothetical protein